MTTIVKDRPLTIESLFEQIKELSQESLIELSHYVEFLKFKVEQEQREAKDEPEIEEIHERSNT
jgi:hypothetical protein